MMIERDQADKDAELQNQAANDAEDQDQAAHQPAGNLPPMTPETARQMAAILAPHLLAMRAVTHGTRYAGDVRNPGDDVNLVSSAPPVSPATAIFIAGMLERIPA
jgi:hypothetical protein